MPTADQVWIYAQISEINLPKNVETLDTKVQTFVLCQQYNLFSIKIGIFFSLHLFRYIRPFIWLGYLFLIIYNEWKRTISSAHFDNVNGLCRVFLAGIGDFGGAQQTNRQTIVFTISFCWSVKIRFLARCVCVRRGVLVVFVNGQIPFAGQQLYSFIPFIVSWGIFMMTIALVWYFCGLWMATCQKKPTRLMVLKKLIFLLPTLKVIGIVNVPFCCAAILGFEWKRKRNLTWKFRSILESRIFNIKLRYRLKLLKFWKFS